MPASRTLPGATSKRGSLGTQQPRGSDSPRRLEGAAGETVPSGRGPQPGELPGPPAGLWAAESSPAAPPQPGQVSCLQSCSALPHVRQHPSTDTELLFHFRALGRRGGTGRPKVCPGVQPLAVMGHDCEKAEITPPLPQTMPALLAAPPAISGHLQKPHQEPPAPKPPLWANAPGGKSPVISEAGKNLSLAKECFSWDQVLNLLFVHVFGFIPLPESRDHPQHHCAPGCPATQQDAGEGVPGAGCRDGPRLQGLQGGFSRPEQLLLFHVPLPGCLSGGWDGACGRGKLERILCHCLHSVKVPNNIFSLGFPTSEFLPAFLPSHLLLCLALACPALPSFPLPPSPSARSSTLGTAAPKYLQYLPARGRVLPGHGGSLTMLMPRSCHAHTW